MIGLVVVLVAICLPLAALLFGADSRDGRDWKPLSRFVSADADRPMVRVPNGVGRHLHRKTAHT
ncbi:MAG: hypothetical protein ABSG36_02290 [Acidimicrobiales bacterium]|jgi:hypothetical protein